MDETKLLNYLKGESDAEECLEVEAWYHASAEHKNNWTNFIICFLSVNVRWQWMVWTPKIH